VLGLLPGGGDHGQRPRRRLRALDDRGVALTGLRRWIDLRSISTDAVDDGAGLRVLFALGTRDPSLRPDDVAHAVRVVLEQPRSVRATVWQLWSTQQQS
jgi:hypothetical protein